MKKFLMILGVVAVSTLSAATLKAQPSCSTCTDCGASCCPCECTVGCC